MKTAYRTAVVVLLLLSGCARNSGVIRMGPETYMVSKQAATGFTGLGTLKADAIKEAYGQCSKTGRSVKIISDDESHPPFIFGNFPRVDLTFTCVQEN